MRSRPFISLAGLAAIAGIALASASQLASPAPLATAHQPRRRVPVDNFKQGREIDAWNKAVDERNQQKRQDKLIRAMQRRRG